MMVGFSHFWGFPLSPIEWPRSSYAVDQTCPPHALLPRRPWPRSRRALSALPPFWGARGGATNVLWEQMLLSELS